VIPRLVYSFIQVFSRGKGLVAAVPQEGGVKRDTRQKGIRGETFAYWYLRRHGYRPYVTNFTYPGIPGEIDFVGYDGPTLAFVEVKLRCGPEPWNPRPEDAVENTKRRNLMRIARQFLRFRGHPNTAYRFDVLAIDSRPGQSPSVRLTKGAFGMRGEVPAAPDPAPANPAPPSPE
jgi:putative endonuclease